MTRKGFTLIELLIVVAIIAILAAIAVPNFLEAQVRSKVSRAKADLRTSATALEAYVVDYNTYPLSNPYGFAFNPPSGANAAGFKATLERLTTPVAYMTSGGALKDPFMSQRRYSSSNWTTGTPSAAATNAADVEVATYYRYTARDENGMAMWDANPARKPKWWILECCGPDRTTHNLSGIINSQPNTDVGLNYVLPTQYDPTNGTVSRGSVWRVSGQPTEPGLVFFRACQLNQR